MNKVNKIPKDKASSFYKEVIGILLENGFSFLIGGAFALRHYTGIYRDTKDLDIFCKAGDYPDMIHSLSEKGFEIEVTDPRWLAKAFKRPHFVDFIFNSTNNICPVMDSWFENTSSVTLFDHKLKLMGIEEMIWTKLYVHNRERY